MADPDGIRKLEAILAADVVEYSRLMQEDDESTVATLETYRSIFREKIQARHGRVVDMAGDSVLAVFNAASEAVRAACEIQAVLAKRNAELFETRRMRFRMGINLGEVIEKPDGTVYGDGVNIAARLQGLAEPEEIWISGTAYDHVKNKIGVEFDSLGDRPIKNMSEPVRAYRVRSRPTDAKSARPVALNRKQVSFGFTPYEVFRQALRGATDTAASRGDR